MKFFAIGDGDKRISCPDRYCADFDGDNTTIIWDPEKLELPIRVTVISISPKDKEETEAGFWFVIRKAQEHGDKPLVVDRVATFRRGSKDGSEGGCVVYFREAGFGNHVAIFSLTVPDELDGSPEFQRIDEDLSGMIATLVERQEEQQFNSALLESDRDRIAEAMTILEGIPGEVDRWGRLQTQYEEAMATKDRDLAVRAGMILGELMREEVPSFAWSVKIDEWGRSLALDLGDTMVSNFPVDMVLKRFDRQEQIDLRELAENTFDALEDLLRKHGSDD